MARLVPDAPDPATASTAERRLLERLAKLPAEWAVLHSVGLSIHDRKPWAEIDFVVIGPPGVFCLEVKGGRLARREGLWIFTDREGVEHSRAHGPFEQVGGADGALHRFLTEKLRWSRNVVHGYGVMTPDIRFQLTGPDIEARLVYDERDEARPMTEYIARLAAFWTTDQRVGGRALTQAQAKEMVDLIRGDFDLRPSLRARIARVNSELLKLTVEEFRVLDGLAENDRAIVSGGAGTGKTLLAVEEAIRLEKQGARVLLCCYNRQLAKFLERVVEERSGITAATLHAVMREIIQRDGRHPELLDEHDDATFRLKYPAAVVDALVNLRETAEFDALIVDEGQDLLSGAYLDVMDLLLIGGWRSGRWRVFLDQKQNMYLPARGVELDRLNACPHVSYRLTINCRNTRGVAIQTSLLSMIDSDAVLRVDGPTPKLIWYGGRSDQLRQVANEVNRLLSEGIDPAQIVLLSDMRFENSLVSAGLPGVRCTVCDISKFKQTGSIGFSTIHAFKGLEEDAVILLDVDDIASPDARTNLYVGSSRARAYLTVCLDERVRADYERQAEDFGRRLGGRL